MRRLITSQRGFSLIETMMAFGILAVGMMAVASMITTSLQFDRRSISRRDGYHVAMEKFEELKKDYTRELYPGSVDPPDPDGGAIEEDVEQGVDAARRKTGFRRKCIFQCMGNCVAVATGVKACKYKVTIRVGWGDSPTCTKSDPLLCPHKTEFTNYIIIHRDSLFPGG